MSDKNGETSTFEMETKENFDKILQAISGMRQDFTQRLDKIEAEQSEIRKEQTEIRKEQTEIRKELSEQRKEFTEFKDYVEVQFEAIRQGLVKNHNRFDLLESQIAEIQHKGDNRRTSRAGLSFIEIK